MNKFRQALSSKAISVFILIISITGRLIQVLFFFNYRSDRSYQILATRNLTEGHGITIAQVLPNDLSITNYQPITEWPPGYTIFALPFYILFPHNYMMAGLVLDMLSSVLLLLASQGILGVLGATTAVKNIYTLVAGFFIYEFIFKSSSDLLAITFFIVAIYGSLLILKGHKRSVIYAIGVGLFLFFSGAVKYMFIPVAFIVPLFLTLKGIADKDNRLKKAGLITLLTCTIGLALVVAYQKYVAGTATKLYGSEYGFYPENLLDTYPFLPASFLKPSTFTSFVNNDQFLEKVMVFFTILNLVMLIGTIVFIVWMFRKTDWRKITLRRSFVYLSIFLSAGIILLLAILSIRLKKIPEANSLWIYIQEPRYFGLIAVLVQLSFFLIWTYRNNSLFQKAKAGLYFLSLLLCLEVFHGIVFDVIRVLKFRREEYSWQMEDRLQKHADKIIRIIRDQKDSKNIVVACSHFYLSNRISMYSHVPVLYDVSKINNISMLHIKQPILLLVIIRKTDEGQFQPFLSNTQKNEVGTYEDLTYYTLEVRL